MPDCSISGESTKTTVDALVQTFTRTGIPNEILLDQESNLFFIHNARTLQNVGYSSVKRPLPPNKWDDRAYSVKAKENAVKVFKIEEGLGYCYYSIQVHPICNNWGSSTFVFGREVRGPPNVLKKTWTQITNKAHWSSTTYFVLWTTLRR